MQTLNLVEKKVEKVNKFLIITKQCNYACFDWKEVSKKITALKILDIPYAVFYRNSDNSYSQLLVNIEEVKCFD